jgi:sulfate transport system substrate-binding protein
VTHVTRLVKGVSGVTSAKRPPPPPVSRARKLDIFAVALVVLAIIAIGAKNIQRTAPLELLNVSYDPTRELYKSINQRFSETYEKGSGNQVIVKQSHGGSSRQARSVIAGDLAADVVTLGLYSDVDSLRKRGLIADNWWLRLPNHSQPYYSTIVFVVRRGNPSKIHDWPDLIKPNIEIITPDPKGSGNGKLSALGAWGAVLSRGGSEQDAQTFLKELYEHTPFLEAAARSAAIAFAVEKLGDVHLTWENEALREVAESKGDLQIIYPPISILAEPVVSWVDTNVAKHKSASTAKAYLEFLFSDAGQEIIAENGYRPFRPDVLKKYASRFPELNLFHISKIAKDWDDAQQKFFGENGIIDLVYHAKPR